MKISKKIAICGISTALGGLCLAFVIIAPTGKLALFVIASLAVMLPLSKKLYTGAAVTVLATSAIGFISGGLLVYLPYILVFGIHPLINALLDRFIKCRFAVIIKTAIKLVYFLGVLYLLYTLALLAKLFLIEVQFYILAIIVAVAFIPYDYLMQLMQKRVEYFLQRYTRI